MMINGNTLKQMVTGWLSGLPPEEIYAIFILIGLGTCKKRSAILRTAQTKSFVDAWWLDQYMPALSLVYALANFDWAAPESGISQFVDGGYIYQTTTPVPKNKVLKNKVDRVAGCARMLIEDALGELKIWFSKILHNINVQMQAKETKMTAVDKKDGSEMVVVKILDQDDVYNFLVYLQKEEPEAFELFIELVCPEKLRGNNYTAEIVKNQEVWDKYGKTWIKLLIVISGGSGYFLPQTPFVDEPQKGLFSKSAPLPVKVVMVVFAILGFLSLNAMLWNGILALFK